ncbi:MAG: sugar phosphate isomerase/epimerase [Planctomycetota bacterium]|nr:sugar phosphate isomerase/epimerase [Planctomycetota bacterium]
MDRPNLKLAVVAAALSTDVRQAPRIARTLGFDGLLFDAYSAALSLPDLSQSGRREFRHVLAAESRQLVGLRADLGAKGLTSGVDVDRVLSLLTKAMEAAAGLQAPLLCTDLGPLPVPPAEPKPVKRATPDMAGLILLPNPIEEAPTTPAAPATMSAADVALAAQIDAVLLELGARADRFGVTVAFRSDLSPLAALERALRSAACPWFGVDLDPVGTLRDEWPLDEIFSRFGPLIRHVRGRDANRGAGGRTSPAVIGTGSVNWPELLSNLDAAGYHGWVTVDPMELPDRVAAAGAGLNVLRPPHPA